ncbi:sigma-70 family RNA polymerase sigma factor [Trinickia sp. LjRoot230]|uniref:sigma-70 family RNA polymerase sigma factor n=1 Tax=Trinickia sp. LjRoot230 TaxID=3342288 RepID=UPI003ECE7959
MPFIVDYESRSITKFGRPCLVARNGKMIPLGPREFNAGALLIEHMGQYVSIAKLCSHLGCDAAQVPEIMTQVRRALGLGSSQNPRGSSLVLMPDAKPVRGYGIFIAPHGHDTYTPDASPRGTLEALLSDIEGGAGGLQVLSIEQNMAVVRLEDLKARLYFGSIKSRAPVRFYVNAMPEPLPADQATNVHDVMIGWDASRGVYATKRWGRPRIIGHALLEEAKSTGLAYHLDVSTDVENGIFAVESTFAARPDSVAVALERYIEHQHSQTEGIPSNITTHRDMQAMIVARLGASRHGLFGVNPLPVYDLPAPLPRRALLYVNRVMPQRVPGVLAARPLLPGHKQGLVVSFYQHEEMATFVLGLYEDGDTTIVVAWDPASHPALKNPELRVDEETVHLATQKNDVVGQLRQKLALGHAEEVLAAPLERLDKLVEARLRRPPKQRMIDALSGNAHVINHLNAHTWTMVIDERLFHVQWCGPLLRGNTAPHVRPFSVADRFVASDSGAIVLYAGHDPQNDVVVLWAHAAGEPMYKELTLGIPEHVVEEAARTGMAKHAVHIGRQQVTLREAIAATYETGPLTSALSYLSREQDDRKIWRSRNTDIHQQLSEHLQPIEWSDWERDRTRPWPIVVDLPTRGRQSLDVFAYRAQASETRLGSIAITIRPFIANVAGRTSLFAAGREPVLLGEWKGVYVLFDPRVRPMIKDAPQILITVSRDHLEAVRSQGLARMTRPHRHGEFQETIIFATGKHLLGALDLRLRTLPGADLDLIRERLDMSDPQALAEMAMRLQRAMRLSDRDALTGTREVPKEMIVVTGPPHGIKVIAVQSEIRRALQTTRGTGTRIWLRQNDTERAVLLHAGLRAVLQAGEAPRWPAQAQFDVLWALTQAAVHKGAVSDALVQTACRNSLQWLFIGKRAPFELRRHGKPDSYQVQLRGAVAGAGRSVILAPSALDLILNHSTLYAAPKARPDIVWAFIKKVGPARILPKGSAGEVVFELGGQRVWVYGLTNTLHRAEDGQTNYVTPALSQAQWSRIRSTPNDQHILAAFDPGRGNYAWVFWSARPHLEHLHDPAYRLHVSADLPDEASEEWRQLDENREERVVVYSRSRYDKMTALLRRLATELPQESLASLQAQASSHGVTLKQVIACMTPTEQIGLAMRYGLAPYKRYPTVKIRELLGESGLPTSAAFQRAANLARASIEAGEPLPDLAEILRLLRDPHAERYVGSRVLLTMLRELYGLEQDRPASLAKVFRDRGLSARVWRALSRELVMRLIRGATEDGKSTATSTTIEADALPGGSQYDTDPVASAVTREAVADDQATEDSRDGARDEIAAAIALPDSAQLEASYALAIAALRRERSATWPPDVALPAALSRLPPDVELILRAYLGVWPYRHRYTVEQVATEFDIQSHARSRLLIRLASDELIAHAELLSGITWHVSEEARPTLERLATLLTHRAEVLADDELNAVLVRHGLAAAELLVAETTRRGVISEFRPSLQYRRAIHKLTGSTEMNSTDNDDLHWAPEQVDLVYRRIDAGEYAKYLLLLRDPATYDETFADMVLRSVNASGNRALHRASALQGKRISGMKGRQTTLRYEEAVTRTFGFDPNIDTFLRRSASLDAVRERALRVTDEEAQWLSRVVDDGEQAFNEFLEANVRLAYFAAKRIGYDPDRPETSEILVDAISGLQRAIWGHKPQMSFAFSTYAVSAIRSTIYRLSAIRYAKQFNVGIQRGEEIISTRAARNQLLQQAAASGMPQQPSLEALARSALAPLLRSRLVHQLKTEPSATQLRAGWRKYKPEFLRRIEQNIEFIDAYDRINRTVSFDRSLGDDGHANLYDLVASAQPLAPLFPGDEPDNATLVDNLKAALDSAGLGEREQFVLRHYFGITGYAKLSPEEIGARQGINEDAVPQIVAQAAAKVGQSPQARELLISYLRP